MNKRKYELHAFMESLYNDIRERYLKNIQGSYVLYSPAFCPNTGEYGAKRYRIQGGCFLNLSFKFQPNVCNRCHDLIMMSMNLSNIAILNVKGSDYHCIISLIRKNEAINLM